MHPVDRSVKLYLLHRFLLPFLSGVASVQSSRSARSAIAIQADFMLYKGKRLPKEPLLYIRFYSMPLSTSTMSMRFIRLENMKPTSTDMSITNAADMT